VNANNLANTDTPGFKAQRVFGELMQGAIPSIGTAVDTRPGSLQETGAPLDLALIGEGLFLVDGPNGLEGVRSGSFSLDPDGRLIDSNGAPLLGEGGPIVVPPGPVVIDARGGVSVAGELVDRLRIVRSTDPVTGPLDPASIEEVHQDTVSVRQGFLEDSNVTSLDALIEMTTIQRSFESVRNAVRAIDSMMDTAVNRIGRVD
jgi:flagellar basal body rod protein FlgG